MIDEKILIRRLKEYSDNTLEMSMESLIGLGERRAINKIIAIVNQLADAQCGQGEQE